MKCVNPLVKTPEGFTIGKYVENGITYWLGKKGKYVEKDCVRYPCRKCVYCLQARAQEWSMRAEKELEYHQYSCVLTITYDEESNTDNLSKKDIQMFIDRLRKTTKKEIRYIIVGEYGTHTKRPHYHAVIYGWKPLDKIKLPGDNKLFYSNELNQLWGKGMVAIDVCVTPQSIKYVVGYTLGKLIKVNKNGSEKIFMLASRRPAIGKRWYDDNCEDIKKDDKLYIDGHQSPIGEYYTRKIKEKMTDAEKEELSNRRKEMIVEEDFTSSAETNMYRQQRMFERFTNNRKKL